MIKKLARAAWELASTLVLVLAVETIIVAEEVAPWQTERLVRRFEPQMDRLVDFLLRE